MTAEDSKRSKSFPPVLNSTTRILVLGSLPGVASLKAAQYYAHPRNQFWELVGAAIGDDLRSQPYEARLASLLEHGVGLWDVIAEAERKGSLDTAIRNVTHNGLIELLETLPALRLIAFNGGKAAQIGRRQLGAMADRWALMDLPSSSPAHTIALAQKQQIWNRLREF
jgi:hypoxanthine-DNA glycosylase